jgi:hypothetical protein
VAVRRVRALWKALTRGAVAVTVLRCLPGSTTMVRLLPLMVFAGVCLFLVTCADCPSRENRRSRSVF